VPGSWFPFPEDPATPGGRALVAAWQATVAALAGFGAISVVAWPMGVGVAWAVPGAVAGVLFLMAWQRLTLVGSRRGRDVVRWRAEHRELMGRYRATWPVWGFLWALGLGGTVIPELGVRPSGLLVFASASYVGGLVWTLWEAE